MTEERYRAGSSDETDARVSASYRELARERTPEHLDQAVLRAAAKAARPRYSRLRSWTRPLAWAATVVLSVAVVLEITRLPAPESVLLDAPASDTALESEATADAEDVPGALPEAKTPEGSVPASAAPARAVEKTQVTPGAAAARRAASPQSAPTAVVDDRQDSFAAPEKKDLPTVAEPQAEARMDQLRPKEADMLLRAEEQARARAGEVKESAGALDLQDALPVKSFSVTAEKADAAICSEAAIAAPETWLECIEELEAAGMADEAQLERERLLQAFPGFELP